MFIDNPFLYENFVWGGVRSLEVKEKHERNQNRHKGKQTGFAAGGTRADGDSGD